ncbi:TonB-dependent receptor domain-containing protein [uncultured Bacteroides sp.]|uniref:TonB-dependent receptor n=1 Tax=uncultured Bacteroides sp. TaxID=162156 RepID=UPI002AA92443|nr:TonB-dependent receptor [uncultured Bacteroides sp.]
MRKKIVHFLLVALLTTFCAASAVAQTVVKGKVVDAETNEPLIGASVMVEGTTQGVVTDLDGLFTLNVKSAKKTLFFKYIGYNDLKMKVGQTGKVDLGTVKMEANAVALSDITITSSIAIQRKTPVAVSTVDPIFIEEKLGTQEFPEILKSTPGVYATKNGGGYGDSKINMRGFQSANVAVMVNGVPMNDMEWGGVYWSNWTGLTDVARSIQTQRGLGASKVSAPSVGGSINVVTRTIDAKKGGFVSYAMGDDGYNKILFNVSTGLTKNGWAMTLLGGKTWGDGYVKGTEFEAYNYFINIAKKIGDNHQISFSAFGSPQWHNQRSAYDGLSIEGWQQVKNYMNGDSPYKYNATFGYGKNGERKTSSYNVYHKPQLSLNHLWQINDKSSLSTALYASIGRGYGYSGQGYTSTLSNSWFGSTDGTLNTTYRNSDGTFAYDQIYALNEASQNGSQMAMSKSINNHNWYGLLSTFTSSLTKEISYYLGLDLRYYKGQHTNELVDLYGGDFYIDRYRASVSADNNSAAALGSAFTNQKLKVGDVVYRNYNGYVMQEGVFGQIEYNKDKLSSFISGSVSNTGYWRKDLFYYDAQHAKSETLNFIGYTVKGGANYNLTENHNIFANIGYISRAPFFSGGAFLSSTVSNATNPDAINEKIFSLEVGYGYRSQYFSANINAYRTAWLDKTTTRTTTLKNGDRATINMSGVDALHQGVELDLVAHPLNWLDITGMFSIGDWKWNSNATGYFYDSAGQPLTDKYAADGITPIIASGIQAADHAKMTVYQKGTPVGGSAQTTAAAGAKFKLSSDLKVGLDYTLYARNYADFALASTDINMNGSKTFESPWRIPSAGLVDLDASYSFKIGSNRAVLYGNVENLFDQKYIADAFDGGGHTWQSAYRVFYGFGRTYSVRLKLNF